MNTYQRLKQENEDLRNKVNRLQILLQKDHFINEWNKRKDEVLSIETPTNRIMFIVMDAHSNFVPMSYIKSAKKVYVDDVFILHDDKVITEVNLYDVSLLSDGTHGISCKPIK